MVFVSPLYLRNVENPNLTCGLSYHSVKRCHASRNSARSSLSGFLYFMLPPGSANLYSLLVSVEYCINFSDGKIQTSGYLAGLSSSGLRSTQTINRVCRGHNFALTLKYPAWSFARVDLTCISKSDPSLLRIIASMPSSSTSGR